MFKLICVATFVVCCIAAPAPIENDGGKQHQHNEVLQRPSPINPEVPSAPKPAEKVTKITDPKEIAKYKREINPNTLKAFLPTVTPDSPSKTTRAHQPDVQATNSVGGTKTHRDKRDIVETSISTSTLASVPTIYHDQALHAEQSTNGKTDENHHDAHPLVAPSNDHNNAIKRDIPVPLVPKHHHDETTVHEKKEDESKHKADNVETGVHSAIIEHEVSSTPTSINQQTAKPKRDIPVPLVPKHHHDGSQEHPKKSTESKSDEVQVEDLSEHHANKKHEEHVSTTHESTSAEHPTPIAAPLHSSEHPAVIRHPIPVAELFAHHSN